MLDVVELELPSSCCSSVFEDRGAVAGEDFPLTGSMSLHTEVKQLGKSCNNFQSKTKHKSIFYVYISFLTIEGENIWERAKSRNHLTLNVCLPLISRLTWGISFFKTSIESPGAFQFFSLKKKTWIQSYLVALLTLTTASPPEGGVFVLKGWLNFSFCWRWSEYLWLSR